MRLTKKLIFDTTREVIGQDALPVVEYLQGRKNISEFKIAEKIDREVNWTRNILYRLFGHNLVYYHRKKDRQKGWYISYWTFNPKRVKELVVIIKKERLEKLKARLEKEEVNQNNFYMCVRACTRLDFDTAVDFNFKCPECGQMMNLLDNTKTIENLHNQIKEAEKDLKQYLK